MLKICKNCSQEWNAKRSSKQFCGTECANEYSARKPKVCLECNTEFTPKEQSQKFCSRSCGATHSNKLKPKRLPQGNCLQCNKAIRNSYMYCSKECRAEYNKFTSSYITCRECKQTLSLSDFHISSYSRTGRQHKCIECNRKIAREWHRNNRHVRYNISLEDLEELIIKADGICELCDKEPAKTLVIDHCHITNKVRGLICSNCNTALGMVHDNIQTLQNMIKYLQQ